MNRSREAGGDVAARRRRQRAATGPRGGESPAGRPHALRAHPASPRGASGTNSFALSSTGASGSGRAQGHSPARVPRSPGTHPTRTEPKRRPGGTPCGQIPSPLYNQSTQRAGDSIATRSEASPGGETGQQRSPAGASSVARLGQHTRSTRSSPRTLSLRLSQASLRAGRAFLAPPPPPPVPPSAGRGRGQAQLRDTPWLERPADLPLWREALREAETEHSELPAPTPAAAEEALRSTLRRYRLPYSSVPPLPALPLSSLAAPVITTSGRNWPRASQRASNVTPRDSGPRHTSPWEFIHSSLEEALKKERERTDATRIAQTYTRRSGPSLWPSPSSERAGDR